MLENMSPREHNRNVLPWICAGASDEKSEIVMMFVPVLTESGFGRYDVMLLPKSKRDNAIILEFKVREPDSEKHLKILWNPLISR